ncbi:MAG: hypothetical protein ACNA8W_21980 [Bradymonadaceae bacterium]
MSRQASPPPKPASLDAPLIVAFAICLAINVGLYFVFIGLPASVDIAPEETGPEQTYRFGAMKIDAQRLARARDQHQGEARLDRNPEEIAYLHALVREANAMQFPTEPPVTPAEVEQLERKIIFAANEVIPATGLPGFTAAGEPIFKACLTGLEELLLAIRRGSVDLTQARKSPPERRFQAYRENCGNALDMLLGYGLITEDASWRQAHGPTIFEILLRFRWAHMIHAHIPVRAQLPRYEYEILARWRVEDPYAFPSSQRHRFLSELTSMVPDYDVPLANARIEAEGREWPEIIAIFQKLTEEHPNNRHYASILRAIEKAAQ